MKIALKTIQQYKKFPYAVPPVNKNLYVFTTQWSTLHQKVRSVIKLFYK